MPQKGGMKGTGCLKTRLSVVTSSYHAMSEIKREAIKIIT